MTKHTHENISRRGFLARAGFAGGGLLILPSALRSASGKPPSEKLHIAAVGIGGMGWSDIQNWGGENVVALCDVDETRTTEAYRRYPKARRFKDYRRMFDEMAKDIDAVSISTPDHMHEPIAMAAMALGKHIYVQKPMAQTIAGARRMTGAVRQHKVVGQMGIQKHASEGIRLTKEWVAAGLIGTVREVSCWTNRPIWPQGMTELPPAAPVPSTLDWPLWRGDKVKYDYNPAFLPENWRGWYAFGVGALGDMGTHIFDFVSWALDLGVPEAITGLETSGPSAVAFPKSSKVLYEFGARGERPPVKLTWYDGGLTPPQPDGWPANAKLEGAMIGALLHGDKGTIWINHAYAPVLLPVERMTEWRDRLPPKTLPRVEGSHYANFIRACKGLEEPGAPFDYSGPLTEVVLAGAIAQRLPGQRLVYEPEQLRFRGNDQATALIHHSLPG